MVRLNERMNQTGQFFTKKRWPRKECRAVLLQIIPIGEMATLAMDELVRTKSNIRKIAFLGDYLPRKCGIATFTSDLLSAVAAEHPQCQCFAVPVNDIEGGYEYPDVVRFEIV